eukprot:TRINITY_DN102231_c0_g1_i1.p1 TRINITY_DN102231_c0_g1~~TRINITY_DN102231_c0_g1_i1.p1  ORF type:complete len:574 (+),score=77.29 TRINITY_DN102231_c0_g1_i1:86-1807(+)
MALSREALEDWRACLNSVCQHELGAAVEHLRAHLSKLDDPDAPTATSEDISHEALDVGHCGAAVAGIYKRHAHDFQNREHDVSICFCEALDCWVMTSSKFCSGTASELRVVRFIYGLGDADSAVPVLFYVRPGRCPLGQWTAILGDNPAPFVRAGHVSQGLLTTSLELTVGDTFRKVILLHDIWRRILETAHEFKADSWALSDFTYGNIASQTTTVTVAMRIARVVELVEPRRVCRAWKLFVDGYSNQSPSNLLKSLQLHGDHRQPISPVGNAVQLFMTPGLWSGMLDVVTLPAFTAYSWPVRINSICITTPTDREHYRVEPWFKKLAKPLGALAHTVLQGVPLPWKKGMNGLHSDPESILVTDGYVSADRGRWLTQELLDTSFGRGEQSLHTKTELLVGPHGLVTRDGELLSVRERLAVATFLAGQGWEGPEIRTRTTWSCRRRRSSPEPCWLCEDRRDRKLCIRCQDKRHWSYLEVARAVDFKYRDVSAGLDREVTLTIQGTVLPFLSTTDDVSLRPAAVKLLQSWGVAAQEDWSSSAEEEDVSESAGASADEDAESDGADEHAEDEPDEP